MIIIIAFSGSMEIQKDHPISDRLTDLVLIKKKKIVNYLIFRFQLITK